MVPNIDAKDGDWVECPVSGVPLHVAAGSTRVEFGGSSYVLCCGGCATKFTEDPTRFLEARCQSDKP